MTKLEDLLELDRLRRIVEKNSGRMDTPQLEKEFLEFSAYSPKRALTVRLPKLYTLREGHAKRVADALASVNTPADRIPGAIDISGCFSYDSTTEAVVFLSLQQVEADHYSSSRSCLNPLIEKIYMDGCSLIRDFSIHEALVGKVVCKRGDLDLREVGLFPNKFITGPYSLVADLDTPAKTVKKFSDLHKDLAKMKSSPKECLLNPIKVQETSSKAAELRNMLGALSRYESPESQAFKAATNSCVIRTKSNTLFYLYSLNHNRNIMVYFGDAPFKPGNEPKELLVLMGKDHQHTLPMLLELGVFDTSETILAQRIKDFTEAYENATRGSGKNLSEGYPNFEHLMEGLKNVDAYFKEVVNPEVRRKYVATIDPEILEFAVCPASNEPVVHELLPRLSWNKTLRNYSNTGKFIFLYNQADDSKRKEMLTSIASNIIFSNQQNNDVNVWLYNNHRQFCTDSGIEFCIEKQQ
ncbi:hypothetical protein FJZ53_00730 [Candidatus Woesearchaeota archaeon]|nr:hypothetical protein [Candidatus Woesearchaeota archaeon]